MSSIIKVDTIQNQSGANIISESANTITVGASGDTITVPSGATLGGAGTFNLSSGSVTLNSTMKAVPMFSAYMNSSSQTISTSTLTTIVFDAENYDTDGCFDTSTYRFTPTVAGKYFLFANTRLNVGTDYNNSFELEIRHSVYNSRVRATGRTSANKTWNVATILDFNGSTEFATCTFYQDTGGNVSLDNGNGDTLFGGFRIVGA